MTAVGGLSLSLNNALSGLNINQNALAVLSQNIANANTAGYSRQVLSQEAVYLDGQGQGVTIASITRKIDEYLNRAVQGQQSELGLAAVVNDYNARIQLMMGNPNGNNSIDAYLNVFFNSLQALAQAPQNTTLQQTAVNAGATLAAQIKRLAEGLRDLQFEADKDIGLAVTQINNGLDRLAKLNNLIIDNSLLGKSASELEDQRDGTLKDLAQYINISTFKKDTGAINVTTSGGISILDDNDYRFAYNPTGTPLTFSDGSVLAGLTVARVDDEGNVKTQPIELLSSDIPTEVTTPLTGGKVFGLHQLRDELLPDMLAQLDALTAALRDQINAIHNAGSGYPGANSYTGTRAVSAGGYSQWSGSVRIAVLDNVGAPVGSPYADEGYGFAPLTLDLSRLNSLNGEGNPSAQDIIDAINQYYTPRNKAAVGNLNNIQMVSDTRSLPDSPPSFSFDFDLSNLSATDANFYVTGVQVLDNTGADITSISSTIPSVALSAGSTYVTTAGSDEVVINTAAAHTLLDGDIVYLSNPGVTVDGIAASSLTGYFRVSNVTSTSFQITAGGPATAGATTGVAGQTAMPPYQAAQAGATSVRASSRGLVTADLSGNGSAPFYTIRVTVGVDDGSGNVVASTISYRVNNQQPEMFNLRFAPLAVTGGDGELVMPTSQQPLATAMLVDANGKELPKLNGKYTNQENGYLKLSAANSSNFIVIDSLDSQELGNPGSDPQQGTDQGFSSYFSLNNFFADNVLTATGDSVRNSALNLSVESRLRTNPGLLSLGQLVRGSQAVNPNALPNYTYERNPGDNSIIQRLSQLASTSRLFEASGGLGATTQTLGGYAGQIVGVAATKASAAKTADTNAQKLLEGFEQRVSSIGGVNLDNELANTVVYQNAYAASARVITVTGELFDLLLRAFG